VAMTRRTSLLLLSVVATLWAGLLSIGGMWLMLDGPARWPLVAPVGPRVGGAVLFCAGQFLFMYLVADRWFPRAGRSVTWPLELAATLVLIGGLLWIVLTIGPLRLVGA